MDKSILKHHTAGIEDQLGCSGVTILGLAYIAAITAAIQFILKPRFRRLVTR